MTEAGGFWVNTTQRAAMVVTSWVRRGRGPRTEGVYSTVRYLNSAIY